MPTVSVIIPTYNFERLLPRALDSVIGQTFDDWEIVLVDDGSTDGTPAVAGRYAAKLKDRLNYIRQLNRGASAARNAGIDACRGRFVAFLDADDEFLPPKLERQLALFNRRPELGLVYCDYAYVDLEGVRHPSVFDGTCRLARRVRYEPIAPGLCACADSPFDTLIHGYFIPTIVGMVRQNVLGEAIRFREDLSYAEEWLFYLQVTRACRAGFVDEALCLHHYTPGSLGRTDTHSNFRRKLATLKAIDDTFRGLTRRQRRSVRRGIAETYRQLGYDACCAAGYREAAIHFAESLRYEAQSRALFEATRAMVMGLTGGWARVSTGMGESRVKPRVVR